MKASPADSKTSHAQAILPGATLGILGSGQLGRMFAQAASRLGYRVHVYSPEPDSPTAQVCHRETVAPYDDTEAATAFAQSVDVVTLEFENVSAVATETISRIAPVRPSAQALQVTQDRLQEKHFLQSAGIQVTPFAEVTSEENLAAAVSSIGAPAVLKTAAWGYDGKGQQKISSSENALAAWQAIDRKPAIYEGWVSYEEEFSMLVARSVSGEMAFYGPIANQHENHILDLSVYPAPDLAGIAQEAEEISRTVAEQLEVVGIICIEFFLTTDGRLLVNEIAPRPHNSGHLTIEACCTSQFEQQVRAICDLPLGKTSSIRPAAMVNLLGDLWQAGEPAWLTALADPNVHLHLYGKRKPRPGRKMGHLTVLADTAEEAVQRAYRARERLTVAVG